MITVFKEHMDDTVRPQDDFFRYANGTWLKNNPIPDSEARWSSFNVLRDENWKKLQQLIVELPSDDSLAAGSPKQQVRDFYLAGMDQATSRTNGLVIIRSLLADLQKVSSSSEFASFLGRLHQLDLHPFWRVYVDVDEKNSEQYVFRVTQGGLLLPDRDYYLSQEKMFQDARSAYDAHFPRLSKELPEIGDAEAIHKAVLFIETALAEASMTAVERRDIEAQYNPCSKDEFIKEYSGFDWLAYAQSLGLELPTRLIVDQQKFMTKSLELITTVSLEDLKLYLGWHIANCLYDKLDEAAAAVQFELFGKALSGTTELQPRWKRVILEIDELIGEASGQIFAEKYFPPKAKAEVETLVEEIRAAFAKRIQDLEWMKPETKKYALKKLAKYRVKVGHPETWRDYSSITIVPDNYLGNIIEAVKFDTAYDLARLGKPVDKEEWFMTPPTVNAYHSFNMGEIVFPAGILQPPFYYFQGDTAMNYGAFGMVIGHEFSHGFDDQGSQYDVDNNLQNWRTDDDKKAFDERAEVLIKLADQFEVLPGLKLNGKLTLGENIADLAGYEVSYEALKTVLKNNMTQPALEGFTPSQRFFLAAAFTETGDTRKETRIKYNTMDPHADNKFRVNGILRNIDAWYEAFDVKPGDVLYLKPEERVRIW